MGAFDYRNFDDRKKNSASAKQTLLEKFKARPPADDPEMIAKAEARAAVARARDERAREREASRIAAEKAAADEKRAREETELAAQIAREEEETRLAAERRAEELVARKVARDARYAARKAKARR